MNKRNAPIDDYYMPSDKEMYQNIQRRFKDLRGYINPFLPEDNFQNMIDGFLKSLEASSLWIFDMMSTAIGNTDERKDYENSVLGRKRYPIIKESFRENSAQSHPIEYDNKFPDNLAHKEQIEHVKLKIKRYKVKYDNKEETEGHFHDGGSFSVDPHDHNEGTLAADAHDHNEGTFTTDAHTHEVGTITIDAHVHLEGTFTILAHDHNEGTFTADAHLHGEGSYTSDGHTHSDGGYYAIGHTHDDGGYYAIGHTHDDGGYYAGNHNHSGSNLTISNKTLASGGGAALDQQDFNCPKYFLCMTTINATSYDTTMFVNIGIKNDTGTNQFFDIFLYDTNYGIYYPDSTGQRVYIDNRGWWTGFFMFRLYANDNVNVFLKAETSTGWIRYTLNGGWISPHNHTISGNTGGTTPSVSGSSGTTQPGVSGNSGTTQPGVSGASGTTQPGVSGASGTTQPGVTGTTGTTQPGFSGTSGTTQPGVTGTTGTTQPGFSGTTGTTQPGFSGTTGTTQPGFSGTAGTTSATIDRNIYEIDDGLAYAVKIELNGNVIATTSPLATGDSEEIDITDYIKALADPTNFILKIYPNHASAVIRLDTNFEAKYWFRQDSGNV